MNKLGEFISLLIRGQNLQKIINIFLLVISIVQLLLTLFLLHDVNSLQKFYLSDNSMLENSSSEISSFEESDTSEDELKITDTLTTSVSTACLDSTSLEQIPSIGFTITEPYSSAEYYFSNNLDCYEQARINNNEFIMFCNLSNEYSIYNLTKDTRFIIEFVDCSVDYYSDDQRVFYQEISSEQALNIINNSIIYGKGDYCTIYFQYDAFSDCKILDLLGFVYWINDI